MFGVVGEEKCCSEKKICCFGLEGFLEKNEGWRNNCGVVELQCLEIGVG